MEDQKIKDIPTAEQLKKELDRRNYKSSFFSTLINTFGSLAVAVAIVALLAVFLFPVLRVTGQSMKPTLTSDELVLCNKSAPARSGDVIAFYHNKKILLKRVIGTAGDVIDIKDDGSVFVNGELLDEPYANNKNQGESDITFPFTVPNNRYFVMGDNRKDSVDSRSTAVGCVAEENILGRIYMIVWPFDKVGPID